MTENHENHEEDGREYHNEPDCSECEDEEECADCDDCDDLEHMAAILAHENHELGLTLDELISADGEPCFICFSNAMEEARTDCYGECEGESGREAWLRMATSEDYMARFLVAGNHEAPAILLAYLSEDLCDAVVETVATNPHTPQNILANLAQREEEFIRGAVARNPGLHEFILAALAADDDCEVAQLALANDNCPVELLFAYAQAEEICDAKREVAIQALTDRM